MAQFSFECLDSPQAAQVSEDSNLVRLGCIEQGNSLVQERVIAPRDDQNAVVRRQQIGNLGVID